MKSMGFVSMEKSTSRKLQISPARLYAYAMAYLQQSITPPTEVILCWLKGSVLSGLLP